MWKRNLFNYRYRVYKPVLNGKFRSKRIDRRSRFIQHYWKTIRTEIQSFYLSTLGKTEVKGVICSIEILFSFREAIKPKQRFEVCTMPMISVSLERGTIILFLVFNDLISFHSDKNWEEEATRISRMQIKKNNWRLDSLDYAQFI